LNTTTKNSRKTERLCRKRREEEEEREEREREREAVLSQKRMKRRRVTAILPSQAMIIL